MALTPAILTELLVRAKDEPFGLAVETNNPKRLQIQLCDIQREVQDRDIIICLPSIPDTVFLARRSLSLD